MGWILLSVGICVMAFSSLGIARGQQVSEQSRMREEVELAKTRLKEIDLEGLSLRQDELELKLAEAQSQLNAVKQVLTQSIGSIDASGRLFAMARECGVTINEIRTWEVKKGNLEGIECPVLPLNINIQGDISSLIAYIVCLNERFITGIVDEVDIYAIEDNSGNQFAAEITLLINQCQDY